MLFVVFNDTSLRPLLYDAILSKYKVYFQLTVNEQTHLQMHRNKKKTKFKMQTS